MKRIYTYLIILISLAGTYKAGYCDEFLSISIFPKQKQDTTKQKTDSLSIIVPDNRKVQSQSFYDTLKLRASKRKWTKQMHDLIFVNSKHQIYIQGTHKNEDEFIPHKGKQIINISLVNLKPFGTSIKDTSKKPVTWFDKFGNATHMNSNDYLITRSLLFKEGDYVDPKLFSDNERLLRNLSYLKDVKIVISDVPWDSAQVNVTVITRDLFSIGANGAYISHNSWDINIYESNFLGIGHHVQGGMYYRPDGGSRPAYSFVHKIANLSGRYISTYLEYNDAYHNQFLKFSAKRDFYAYNTKYALGVEIDKYDTYQDIVKTDTTLFDVELNYLTENVWIGRAFKLSGNEKFKGRRKIMLAIRYQNSVFFEGPEVTERYNYQYHNNELFLLALAFSKEKYYKTNLIYGFGRTEDIPIGMLLQLNGGLERDEFYNRFYTGSQFSIGTYSNKFGYLHGNINLGAFIYEKQFEQVTLDIETKSISHLHHFKNFSMRQFIGVNYTYGTKRFPDEYIAIEKKHDIRGFPQDDIFGNQKLSMNIESVFFSNIYLYGFRFVGFVFGDMGFIGPRDKTIFTNKLYTGVGLGLRIRNDNLVFNTFQLRLAYYPNLTPGYEQLIFEASGEKVLKPPTYQPHMPNIIEYE